MRTLYDDSRMIPVVAGGEAFSICGALVGERTASADQRFLLLHGNPSDLSRWDEVYGALLPLGQVLAIDMPGYGRSPEVRGRRPTLDWLADAALAAADAVGFDGAFHVLGQSHGGGVAQTLAARHPSRVRSAVLLGSIGYPANASARPGTIPIVAAVARVATTTVARLPWRGPLAAATRASLKINFAPDAIPAGFVEHEVRQFAAHPEIFATSLYANAGDPHGQLLRQAPSIRAPMFFLHGSADRIVAPHYARTLFDALLPGSPRSRFELLEGAGHMLCVTRGDEVNPRVVRWISEMKG